MVIIEDPPGYKVEVYRKRWFQGSVNLGRRRMALAEHLARFDGTPIEHELKTTDRIRKRCAEIIVTLDGPRVVAFGEITFQHDTARLEYYQVDKACQQAGLGKNIVINAEAEARTKRVKMMVLEVDENAPHRQSLERMGYQLNDRVAANMLRLSKIL